jgi:hypothetical protein
LAKQIIAKVGEMTSVETVEEVSTNVLQLATILVDVGDLKVFPNEISDVFVQCLSTLPVQCTVVASVLSLVYRRDASFPMVVRDKLEQKLVQALNTSNVNEAKIILRSLAAMSCCGMLNGVSLTATLAILCDAAAPITSGRKGKGKGAAGHEWSDSAKTALFLLASTIPWCVEGTSPSAAGLLFAEFLKDYKSEFDVGGKHEVFRAYACPLDDNGNETTPSAMGALSCTGPAGSACWDSLWDAVSFANEAMSGRSLPESMLCPWTVPALGEALREDLSGSLWDGSERAIDALVLSEGFGTALANCFVANDNSNNHLNTSSWLVPVFPLFDQESSPGAAHCSVALDAAERHIFKEYFRDIFHFFDPVINEDGTTVGSMQLMIQHIWAVSKHLSVEKRAQLLSNDGALPSLLIEVLLQYLPLGNTAPVSKLLLELVKSGGASHFQAVGSGVQMLFAMVDEMNSAGFTQHFAVWFSTHLVNTQLTWPFWGQWVNSVKEDNDGAFQGPRSYFCRTVVDLLSRRATATAVHEKLLGVGELEAVLGSSSADGEPVVVMPDGVSEEMVAELRSKIDARAENEEVLEFLTESGAAEASAPVLLQVIMMVSGAIPSAFVSLIDRYSDSLRTLDAESTDEGALMKSLSASTSHDGGLMLMFMDACLRRSVISCKDAAELLSASDVMQSINNNVWVARLLNVVVERTLDIAKAGVAQYVSGGGALPVHFPEGLMDDENNQEDPAVYALQALCSAVTNAQRVHSGVINALVHSSDENGIESSLVGYFSSLYASASAVTMASSGGNLGVELTDHTSLASSLKKSHATDAYKKYAVFL